MFNPHRLRRASLAGLASVIALGAAPGLGWAQPAPESPSPGYDNRGDYDNHSDYDACEKQKADRGVAGAVIGGVIGGLLGSGIAAGGHRTTGTVVGAGAGAIGGAVVGSSSADCDDHASDADRDRYSDDRDQDRYHDDQDRYSDDRDRYSDDHDRYSDNGDSYRDDGGYYSDDRDRSDDRGYDDRASRETDEDSGPDCKYASSPVYMPDGEVQQRQVRVCRDSSGHYRVME